MQEISVATHCPSFSSYSSVRFAEIAVKATEEFSYQREEFGFQPNITDENPKTEEISSKQSSSNNNNNDDFEFAFVSRNPNTSLYISAEEIFSSGRIKPIFPIFNRDLLLNDNKQEEEQDSNKLKKTSSVRLPLRRIFIEERNSYSSSSSSSSSEAEDLESVPSGTYCIWTPKTIPSSPETCKKSYSTGSKPKRFRLKNLINRSNSDFNETSVFLSPPLTTSSSNSINKKSNEKAEISMEKRKNSKESVTKMKTKKVSGRSSSSSMASSHEIHYLRNRALKEGDRKRSYLPYRRDLISLF